MAYRLRPSAEGDIYSIMSYIGQKNPRAALAWQDEIFRTFDLLADLPGIGIERTIGRGKLLFFPKDGYLIFFRRSGRHIEILRVLHGARDWGRLFR
ncbi:type II toxin-antitoxin system RelE/ParE family toxin [Ciceribacter sp. L1K22]|uniref:type II toxin-antitoxin system RelE/ParE family toxin n=1 Tax=Ciceribacter sp. L1K22 TaxID=2820275 RepID=UPI001ABDE02D|nr:type II toxin-antitoxin system RelE/ParE family toxin [Ciceribacter sp. L1K22]MBO3760584.1 type II toxin-antitoxin system RelE/ParE family toxin [Ciceribacter sp. L1K22]